jgi:hypothetical protein
VCTSDAAFIEAAGARIATCAVEVVFQGEYERGEPETSKGEHGWGDAASTVPKQGAEQGIEADEDVHDGLGKRISLCTKQDMLVGAR